MPQTTDIKVLLIDDNEDDIILMKQALENSPPLKLTRYFMFGDEAIDYLVHKAEPIDMPNLIFLDINMPRLNGFEVMQTLKSNQRTKKIPITVLTTSNREEDVERAYTMGASSFITKPFDFDDFLNTTRALATFWSQTALPF